MEILRYLLAAAFGYLIGSIPWALVIGKLFYHTDVRQYGSHNLGATNAGRVLGKKAFYAVAVLDALKGFAVYMIVSHWDVHLAMIASFFAFVGHCYPLFAGFKGGKGVACSAGIVLAVSLTSWSYFLKQFVIPMAVFVVVVLVTRYVSLGSMTAYILAAVMAWIWQPDRLTDVVLTLMCVLVILKHHENIDRLIHHRENKISFAKTKSE